MNGSRAIPTLLLLVCMAQLAVPASLIVRYERTLAAGEPFRFRCAPVDPADPFRGRYVELAFELTEATTDELELRPGDRFYASLEQDPGGFARIGDVALHPPASGAYLRLAASYQSDETIHFRLPFDRYYMDERRTPEAEHAYRQQQRSGAVPAWAVVRVRGGLGVVEELYLDGRPVRELLAEPGV